MTDSGCDTLPVLIAGGGIAGLTLALTLAKHGRRAIVLEARPRWSEAGAGIQLGPNATRILGRLGVASRLARYAVTPDAITIMEAHEGATLIRLPLGLDIAQRYAAPYWVTHRADLLHALLNASREETLISLKAGFRVESISTTDSNVTAVSSSSERAVGTVLVGADGIWSRLCRFVQPDARRAYSGLVAARAIVPIGAVPDAINRRGTSVWLAPRVHLVSYPVHAGNSIAVVAVLPAQEPTAGWRNAIDQEDLKQRIGRVCRPLRALLALQSDWRQWGLYDPTPLRQWSRGATILIGDAAHPILPFLAQGGAMAIEDAYVLGHMLVQQSGPLAQTLEKFERERRPRVAKVQRASRENGRVYHLGGVAASARNFALRRLPAEWAMRRYDWIYNWQWGPDDAQQH
ncbi:MAG: FAD-dependent monooxygenase [Hyphomicrobiaceae bacterium]